MKRAGLRHSGDAPIVWTQPWRNEGPKRTTIVVIPLPDIRARQMVDGSRRWWSGERLIKELKGAPRLGQHQITNDPPCIERSVALYIMAYLLRRMFRAHDMPLHGPWSAFTLKRNFTWQMAQA